MGTDETRMLNREIHEPRENFLTTDGHGFNFSKPVRAGIFVGARFKK